jgi:hypothetical protein
MLSNRYSVAFQLFAVLAAEPSFMDFSSQEKNLWIKITDVYPPSRNIQRVKNNSFPAEPDAGPMPFGCQAMPSQVTMINSTLEHSIHIYKISGKIIYHHTLMRWLINLASHYL